MATGPIEIEIGTYEAPLPGHKYEIDIAFAEKPDYSKVVEEIAAIWHVDAPDSQVIWDQITEAARRYRDGPDLFRVVEPAKDKVSDAMLLAIAKVEGITWYRVKLFLISEDPLDPEDLGRRFESALKEYLGDGTSRGHLRFVEARKLSKFPGEGRLISKKTIRLPMAAVVPQGSNP
jgi:hypothetical protein